MIQLANKVSSAALNLVFPIFCQGCGKNLPYNSKIYLCQGCSEKLRLNSPSLRTLAGEDSFFKQACHCYKYEGLIKELVRKFKYHKKLYLKNTIVSLLHDIAVNYVKSQAIDIIIAVPMHISDERDRGFNQSDILAKELSLWLDIKYSKGSILKPRRTKKQIDLKKAERLKNIQNAFAPGNTTTLKGANVLLIDDVFTTGTTTNECSRVLTAYGAESVSVLTLAKGV